MKQKIFIMFLLLLSSFVLAAPCDDLNTHSTWNDLGGCGVSTSQSTGIDADSYLLFLFVFGLLACLIFDFNASIWYTIYALIAYIGILIAPGDFTTSLFGALLAVGGFFIFRFIQKMFR